MVLIIYNIISTISIILFLTITHVETKNSLHNTSYYTLYIGLNDKDDYIQKIPTEDAKSDINEICCRYVDGFTASEAWGGWTDENDVFSYENTLVYSFYDATDEDMRAIMNDVLKELNQSAVLINADTAHIEYYTDSEMNN